MNAIEPEEITRILHEWNDGDELASERLLPVVYNELKHRARFLMSKERADHTLQPTALVHEAFLKLTQLKEIKWNNREHFYRFVSQLMRQILVDHARLYATAKRSRNKVKFSIEDLQLAVEDRAQSILFLDEALNRLADFDAQQSQIVEMRYFGGMNNAEIAEVLNISTRTVMRDWEAARVWLYREINKQ